MGFLRNLFGGKTKKTEEYISDGWREFVHGVDNDDWVIVDSSNSDGAIEVNTRSCYKKEAGHNSDVYCVIRIYSPKHQLIVYMGCLVGAFDDDIKIIVNRYEREDGSVLQDDDWSKRLCLESDNYPSIDCAIERIRTYAESNVFEKEPRFVSELSLQILRVGLARAMGRE
jgi:hypothetical protein